MVLRRIGKMTAVLGIGAMLLAGCGLFGPEEETASIDAPPQSEVSLEENTAVPTGNSGEAAEQAQGSIDRTLYLLDANGYVVPVSLTLPKAEGAAKQVLAYMVKGGPVETMLPPGFKAVLPEGTKVLGMTIKEGTATVDFSKEFRQYDPKDEKKIIDAISRALTEFNTIKNVSVWVNGHPLSEMPANNTPISTLNREKGINLELSEGATPGQTTPVTVYFQGQLDDKRSYFVPVTRLIPETEDVARAVVEELIKGPKEGSPLFSSLLRTTKVLDVTTEADTVKVNLSGDILQYDSGKEASPEAVESILLSLTENTGANKVQVLVEGKPLASGTYDFSKPVARPVQINAMQF
jgi:germination protein M